MNKFTWIIVFLIACGPTRDNGCGCNKNSEDAEQAVQKQYGPNVVCIADDENTYTCSDETEQKLYRCAESASAPGGVKCIPWFPTE